MKSVAKQLRKYENINLLIISNDDKFKDDAKVLFSNVKELHIVATNDEALELSDTLKFDLVILDNKIDNFKEFFDALGVPLKIIILDSNENNDEITSAINSGAYTILAKPFNIVNLKLSIIMSLNQSNRSDKIKLGQGFYFDTYRDRIYNRYGKVIDLTKFELGLLKLIIKNKGSVVDYKLIETTVWKDRKMSIFAMRNIVNKIRAKTYYDVFKNASSKGYIIN